MPPLAVKQLFAVGQDGTVGLFPLRRFPPTTAIMCFEIHHKVALGNLLSGQIIDKQASFTMSGADFKGELLRLNKELLFQYLELVDTLIERPSSYGREVEAISTVLRNILFLLNHLRCHQASSCCCWHAARPAEIVWEQIYAPFILFTVCFPRAGKGKFRVHCSDRDCR